jgi:hypothetical protein
VIIRRNGEAVVVAVVVVVFLYVEPAAAVPVAEEEVVAADLIAVGEDVVAGHSQLWKQRVLTGSTLINLFAH